MKILVACEESQEVTKAFRRLGHEAYSCDFLDCSGGHPEWHIKADALGMAKSKTWDLIISFPPCTDLSLSGSAHFEKKRLSGQQEDAINFFLDIWEVSNCTENPKNIMSGWKYLNKWYPVIVERIMDIKFPINPTQKIQPWQFGHGETKETWLWLKGLPKLKPVNIVSGREQRIWKMPPSAERGKLRSKTYSGIASAMAHQWSQYKMSESITLTSAPGSPTPSS